MRERPKRPALRPRASSRAASWNLGGANGLVDESVATLRKSLERTARSLRRRDPQGSLGLRLPEDAQALDRPSAGGRGLEARGDAGVRLSKTRSGDAMDTYSRAMPGMSDVTATAI
jgi:hypothetical protein